MYKLAKLVAPIACEAFEDYKLDALTFSRLEVMALKRVLGGIEINCAMKEAGLERSSEKMVFQQKVEELLDIDEDLPQDTQAGPMAQAAARRPVNFDELTPQEKWDIDKRLGILDWDGDPSK